MQEQNFKNHARLLVSYHLILSLLILAVLILSVINLVTAFADGRGVTIAMMFLQLAIIVLLLAWLTRSFALKAQDRAIRAEENLRHYVITGQLLDNKLTVAQVVALRFASHEEFAELAKRAVAENLSPKEIKKAIQQWKADHYRV